MNTKEILLQVDFFADLESHELDYIATRFKEVEYASNQYIFEENSIGDTFYILKKGKVEIIRNLTFDGQIYENELSFFEPYNYFGEMALFDNSPRSASVKAVTEVTLLEINKNDFIEVSLKYPSIVMSLIKTISYRMRLTNDKYMSMWNSLLKKNKMAAIGSAASKIVHDIKTPITVIVLTAQLVEKIFPTTNKYSSKIIKQTEILGEMVKEILDFARGEQSHLDKKPYEISFIFHEIEEDVSMIASSKNIELIFDNQTEGEIFLDLSKIKRTVENIIKNAIEAIQHDGKIEVRAIDEDDAIKILISDSGPGIPRDLLPSIFDPFVTSGKQSGTGLGLAISQKVVSDHQGSIKVYNLDKGGACFDITLPKKQIIK
ncbi:MAG: ATP-binding protein [Candidatus Cloacimonetes bacterium]|nr:ATP-binding protein [Candidatus Cloacimonadota bacterium]